MSMFLSRLLVKQSSAWGARCQLTSQALAWLMTSLSPSDSRAQRIRVSFCRTNSRSALTFILKSDVLIVTFEIGFVWDNKSDFKTFFFFLPVFQANGMNLQLDNGYVILSFNDKTWKSNKQYHDDQWHYLTVTRRAGRYERGSDFTFKHIINSVNIHTYLTLFWLLVCGFVWF